MILVVDANVWIDLDNAAVVSIATKLDAELVVPDLLLEELATVSLPRAVRIRPSGQEELDEIVDIRAGRAHLSGVDAVLLVCAMREAGILVTGDAGLRAAAAELGVEVHGVIWLLQQLIDCGAMAEASAADALQEMMDAGARLPEQARRQVSSWRQVSGGGVKEE